jgi:hypothetical protein
MDYIVTALTVSGLSKKIHRSGDIVNDNDFPANRAKELVNSGFLVEVVEKNTDEPIVKNQELKVEEKTETNNILEEMANKSSSKKGNTKK